MFFYHTFEKKDALCFGQWRNKKETTQLGFSALYLEGVKGGN